jgi:hypothetical protein
VRTSESVDIAAAPHVVFPYVADLTAYAAWLPLVHEASVVDFDALAWEVERRARVGPFARSKRLRMARTEVEPGRLVVFERAETDGRVHARWALRAELDQIDGGTRVTMHLAYDGALWTAGILERVLDEEVRRGRAGLAALVASDQ